jgi:hypothetical protein
MIALTDFPRDRVVTVNGQEFKGNKPHPVRTTLALNHPYISLERFEIDSRQVWFATYSQAIALVFFLVSHPSLKGKLSKSDDPRIIHIYLSTV